MLCDIICMNIRIAKRVDQFLDELVDMQQLGILRSNNIICDLAEYHIACLEVIEIENLPRRGNPGFDLKSPDGIRIQVKAKQLLRGGLFPGQGTVNFRPEACSSLAHLWDVGAFAVFDHCYRLKGAWRLPKAAILPLLRLGYKGSLKLYFKDIINHPEVFTYEINHRRQGDGSSSSRSLEYSDAWKDSI